MNQKTTDYEETAFHLELIKTLVDRMSAQKIALYHHCYDQLAFGSWEIITGKGHSRRKFVWDGKDHVLSAYESVFTNSSAAANWKPMKEYLFQQYESKKIFGIVLDLATQEGF